MAETYRAEYAYDRFDYRDDVGEISLSQYRGRPKLTLDIDYAESVDLTPELALELASALTTWATRAPEILAAREKDYEGSELPYEVKPRPPYSGELSRTDTMFRIDGFSSALYHYPTITDIPPGSPYSNKEVQWRQRLSTNSENSSPSSEPSDPSTPSSPAP